MRWSLANSKLNWYEYLWAIVPLILVPIGGLIGGLCGGAAATLNVYFFNRKLRTTTKFGLTGIISAATIVAFLFIMRFITISIFTETQADRELQAFPVYVSLKKADPEGYAGLLADIVRLKSQSRPQTEIQAAVQGTLRDALRRFQAYASDQAVTDRVRLFVLEIDQIGAKSVDVCVDFIVPNPQRPINLQDYVTPEVMSLDALSAAALLDTGSTGGRSLPEKKDIDAPLAQIRNALVAQFGEDDVAKLGAKQITDHGKFCKMNSAFFKLARSLPRAQAVPVRRYLLSQSRRA
jgi:hypothetical protein